MQNIAAIESFSFAL